MNWRIVAFVIGSTIGSGVFVLPYGLCEAGWWSLITVLMASLLFIFIGYVFGNTKDVFLEFKEKLGSIPCFFLSWLYWLVSWLSTTIVVNELLIYCSCFCPYAAQYPFLFATTILGIFVLINCFGINKSSKIEFIMVSLKLVPLILIPFIVLLVPKLSLCKVEYQQFSLFSLFKTFPRAVWCFVGIECGALMARSMKKEKFHKPILLGIVISCFVYLINTIAIFFVLGTNLSPRPYADLMTVFFGKFGQVFFSFLVCLVLVGTINSWVVASGAAAAEASEKKIFPSFFSIRNKHGSPWVAILVSAVGLVPILYGCYGSSFGLAAVMTSFIDFSSNAFLIFYAAVCLCYAMEKKSVLSFIVTIICLVLSLEKIFYVLFCVALGLPMFFYVKATKSNN